MKRGHLARSPKTMRFEGGMELTQLQQKIEQKQAVIGVIGLGYVGLPVAAMFAQAGFAVIGVDIKAERVAKINAGRSPIEGDEPGLAELLAEVVGDGRFHATPNYDELTQADVVLIDVETPVDENNEPRYEALRSVCHSLGPVLADGVLVVVESTIAPGTIDGVVRPLLEQSSGKLVNEDFFLGACPERVMPGKLLRNLRTMSRVCGGSTMATAVTMTHLYRHIVEADLDTADPITAELVKTAENAYRDVQIAFANEVALICEAVGADVWRVRELVNKSPYRQMHLPGQAWAATASPRTPGCWPTAPETKQSCDCCQRLGPSMIICRFICLVWFWRRCEVWVLTNFLQKWRFWGMLIWKTATIHATAPARCYISIYIGLM